MKNERIITILYLMREEILSSTKIHGGLCSVVSDILDTYDDWWLMEDYLRKHAPIHYKIKALLFKRRWLYLRTGYYWYKPCNMKPRLRWIRQRLFVEKVKSRFRLLISIIKTI